MAYQIKALAAKLDKPSSNSGTHTAEFPQVVL